MLLSGHHSYPRTFSSPQKEVPLRTHPQCWVDSYLWSLPSVQSLSCVQLCDPHGLQQARQIEGSDKTWSPGEGNGKPLQCSCLENPMNSMKRVPLIFCSKSSGKGRRVAEHLGSWRGYCSGQPHIGIFIIWVPLDDSDVLSGLRNTAPLGSDTQPTEALVVQSLSAVQLFVTLWTAACQASLSFTISWSSLKLMSIDSVMLSNHLIICHPLLLLPSVFPSIRVFSNESAHRSRWPKYWNFSFSISPVNECSGLIFFRIDWFDLLAVQGALKSLIQHQSSY